MESTEFPHRCPKCQALVVDRRSPVCTTCRAALPADWVMTPEQAAKTMAIDAQAKAEHLRCQAWCGCSTATFTATTFRLAVPAKIISRGSPGR